MAHAKNHDYHILAPSILPFLGALGGFIMLFGAVLWMHEITAYLFWAGLLMVLYVMFDWWSKVVNESHVGDHTHVVRIGLRYGFILFVMSEVMFFFAWFWSFFKHAMYPMETYVGTEYVAPAIYPVDALHLPLINTLILLLSGCAVTWAHHGLVHGNDRKALVNGLAIGIVLGIAIIGSIAMARTGASWDAFAGSSSHLLELRSEVVAGDFDAVRKAVGSTDASTAAKVFTGGVGEALKLMRLKLNKLVAEAVLWLVKLADRVRTIVQRTGVMVGVAAGNSFGIVTAGLRGLWGSFKRFGSGVLDLFHNLGENIGKVFSATFEAITTGSLKPFTEGLALELAGTLADIAEPLRAELAAAASGAVNPLKAARATPGVTSHATTVLQGTVADLAGQIERLQRRIADDTRAAQDGATTTGARGFTPTIAAAVAEAVKQTARLSSGASLAESRFGTGLTARNHADPVVAEVKANRAELKALNAKLAPITQALSGLQFQLGFSR